MDNCYNSGYVDGPGTVTNNVGGIAGQNNATSTVRHCYYEAGSVDRGDMSNGEGLDGVGTNAETVTVDGVPGETVTVDLKANSKNADTYEYTSNATAGINEYTAEIREPNNASYTVDTDKAGSLLIGKLPVILQWSNPLTFVCKAGVTSTVEAKVSNAIEGDHVAIGSYTHGNKDGVQYTNTASDADGYIAEVDALSGDDKDNYTLGSTEKAEYIMKNNKYCVY